MGRYTLALLFDNSFGWLFWQLRKPKAMTANLNINYKYVSIYYYISAIRT